MPSIPVPRRQTLALIALFVMTLGFGLAIALRGGSAGQVAPRAVGVLAIMAGLFLLLSRHLFRRVDGSSRRPQPVESEHSVRMRLRFMGVGSILTGAALLVPGPSAATAMLLGSAIVNLAGAFRVPRRIFTATSH